MGSSPLETLPAPVSEAPASPAAMPENDWPVWMAPAALASAIVLAAICGLIIDIPAVIFGVKVTSSHIPGGLEIADTIVQDVVFVVTVLLFAHMGGRTVRAAQLGLRRARTGWLGSGLLLAATLGSFFIFSLAWAELLNTSTKEKLLEQLGTNEATTLLLLSAALTCVMAPICEEILFRGFIFSVLRKWRGTFLAALLTGLAFGAVHLGSAPVVDLVPLAALGFALCLLYRVTGSIYPCIVAHSVNNSIAFASLEGWLAWQGLALAVSALAMLGLLAVLLKRLGITSEPLDASFEGTPDGQIVAPAS
jgi:uncharacterized protein